MFSKDERRKKKYKLVKNDFAMKKKNYIDFVNKLVVLQ
tara:strand:+ start:1930 stop:2043 length:114 start_codon:yes stop_codon:yes gene_type:complete